MTEPDAARESFEEFKDTFSYGSRTDLNFKFLKNLPAQEAAAFLQDLLWKLGDSLDDGKLDRLADHVYEWQVRAYSDEPAWTYDEGPFTRLRKPISESRVALVSSSGHFVNGNDPQPFCEEDMTQEEASERIVEFIRAEPTLSAIPVNTDVRNLRVRHPGYDIRGAQRDPNVVFPLERLRELESEGFIGELSANAYSFVGACSQQQLMGEIGPRWARRLEIEQVDAALLVPV